MSLELPTPERKSWAKILVGYVYATIGVIALSAIIVAFKLDESIANISMLYLLIVIVSALVLGRGSAIWASLNAFLAINWFFVNPRYTFFVHETTDWFVLSMFLIVATVTGQLMALLKARALEARQHERSTAALAEASWAVASQFETGSAMLEVLKQMSKVMDVEAAAVISFENEAPKMVASIPGNQVDSQLVLTDSASTISLPIATNDVQFGSVVIKLMSGETKLSAVQMKVVNTLVSHCAVILQRDVLMKNDAKTQALADADRLKTALLSMVSHDFRSPLTSIKASVSTLMSEGEPLDVETQKGLHQTIDHETDRLNRMVGNILDLSRLESDAWRPKLEAISVVELVGMALGAFSREDNLRIDINLDPQLPEVNVDCVQMVQVIKNLVENALKYSDASRKVQIRSRKGGSEAILEVLDRGRGLSDIDAKNIFEPFYRSRELQESSLPGVGVGLAVCKGLVEAHGGSLIAENREDGGATFRVTLPLLAEVGAEPEAKTEPI